MTVDGNLEPKLFQKKVIEAKIIYVSEHKPGLLDSKCENPIHKSQLLELVTKHFFILGLVTLWDVTTKKWRRIQGTRQKEPNFLSWIECIPLLLIQNKYLRCSLTINELLQREIGHFQLLYFNLNYNSLIVILQN